MQENTSDPRRTVVVSPPFTAFYQATHIPAARKAGNRLLLTGHTGDTADGAYSDDVKTQLRQTFRNMEATLQEAGASWGDVVARKSAATVWKRAMCLPVPGRHGSGRRFAGSLIPDRTPWPDIGSSSKRGMTCRWGWSPP